MITGCFIGYFALLQIETPMTNFIASLESYASKYPNLVGIITISFVVWFAAVQWTEMKSDVTRLKEDVQELKLDMKNVLRILNEKKGS